MESATVSLVSRSSSSLGCGILQRQPLEVDGRVFLKVRQCPASGSKNTDLNVIKEGKYGPSFSKHAIWHKGTTENPPLEV